MDLLDIRIFARVAIRQNLSAVASEFGLTTGTISKRIQALEDEFQARLFDRTTRSIHITEEGQTLLVHAQRILTELDGARAAVGAHVLGPRGRLRISAPSGYANRMLSPAICAFLTRFPDIDIHIDLTDRVAGTPDDGYDVIIRTGTLPDSSLIAKRLAPDQHVLAAAPDYIARCGCPRSPDDLVRHSCLSRGDAWTWSFRDGIVETSVRITGRLRSNSDDLLRLAAIEGHGIVCASRMRIADALESGALVQLLPQFEVASSASIWALYPSGKHVLPKLRVFLDFLADWFAEAKGVADLPQAAERLPDPSIVAVDTTPAGSFA